MDDFALLENYTRRNSEEDFRVLTERYVNLVFSSARRQVGDLHLAEEITQAVFIVLARKSNNQAQRTNSSTSQRQNKSQKMTQKKGQSLHLHHQFVLLCRTRLRHLSSARYPVNGHDFAFLSILDALDWRVFHPLMGKPSFWIKRLIVFAVVGALCYFALRTHRETAVVNSNVNKFEGFLNAIEETKAQAKNKAEADQSRRLGYVDTHNEHRRDLSLRQIILDGKLKEGMTAEEAAASWGEPSKKNRRNTPEGDIEFWIYSDQSGIGLKDGIVVTWEKPK